MEHWYHGGDHLILVGWVERAEVDDDNQPLLFHRSRYISATPGAP